MSSCVDDLMDHERERDEWVGEMSDATMALIDAAVLGREAESAVNLYEAVAHRLMGALDQEAKDAYSQENLRQHAHKALQGIRVEAADLTGWKSWEDRDYRQGPEMAVLGEIADIAFEGMECCDQPYFTALSAIYRIATNPDAFYGQMEEARFLILDRCNGDVRDDK